MTNRAELVQGTLDMLILKSLALGPLHGWGISKRLRLMSSEALEVGQGSLYPALYRLEDRGWLASEKGLAENGREVRFYKLTAKGRREFERERAQWQAFVHVVSTVLSAT